MKARLLKRVDLLEVKNAFKFQHVDRLLKYAMEVRRIPSERAKIRSDYDLKEPDLETCREFGQQNVKEIKKSVPFSHNIINYDCLFK